MASRSSEGLGLRAEGWNLADAGTPSERSPLSRFLLALVAVFAFLISGAGAQVPVERLRTEALARRAAERLQALQREADRLATEERTLLGDLRKFEIARQLNAEELIRIDADSAQLRTEIERTSARMDALRVSSRAEIPELQQRLVEIYKLGQARYLRLLLATADLRRLGQSTRTVAALAKLDRDRIATHAQTLAELTATRQSLDTRRAELEALRAAADKARTAAQRAAQSRTDLIRDIDQKRDLNAQLSSELQAAQQQIQATLRALAGGGTPPPEAGQLPLRPFRGALDWPVGGTVTRRFRPGSASNGIEIATAAGADALAVHDGTVAFAGTFAGFGNLVILDHGAQTFSLYGDLLDIAVKKGARIEHGQRVGTAGPIPSGAEGLYFELRVDGRPVDPLQWLKQR